MLNERNKFQIGFSSLIRSHDVEWVPSIPQELWRKDDRHLVQRTVSKALVRNQFSIWNAIYHS